jgi:ribonuclease I
MPRDVQTPEPGDFDLYVLAQSWSPHYCCQRADRCTTVPWAFSARHLSLHGLWPGWSERRDNQPSPLNCKAKARLLSEALPREYIDVAPSFTKWNTEKHVAEVGDLAKHEWKKHGSSAVCLAPALPRRSRP